MVGLLDEPMDPWVDRDKIAAYLRGEVDWDVLNSPEQAQVMDFHLRTDSQLPTDRPSGSI